MIEHCNAANPRRLLTILLLTAAVSLLSGEKAFALDETDIYLNSILRKIRMQKPPEIPSEEMYTKNDIIYCTGNLEAAIFNNRAADLIDAGEYARAKALLEKGLKRAPLFFPFLYNMGYSCIHLRELDLALIYMNRAQAILPGFSRTYLQLGYIYEMKANDDEAIRLFREALKVNHYELESLILIGDIYYRREQINMAEKYYRASLRADPSYANGIIGIAKIHFFRKEYSSTIITLKGVDMQGDYDKALHYYYAESAYKLQDYETAYDHYKSLMGFRHDRFFITHSRSLIRHKLNLTERFVNR